jgi:proteasome lid subunit RPN8/RPN11
MEKAAPQSAVAVDADPAPVALPRAALESLIRWSRAARPAEACGWVLARRGGPMIALERVLAAPNAAVDRERSFELAPASLVAADRSARAAGLEVAGVWHSHPRGPGEPSWADRAWGEAGWLGLIVELGELGELEELGELGAPGAPRVRAWSFDARGWREHALVCGD